MVVAAGATAVLTVDLDALAANYRTLRAHLATEAECAAVVKADGYGLGAAETAARLSREGCKTFFVASLDEGIDRRAALPAPEIYVFLGPESDTVAEFEANRLTPVLNRPDQIALWRRRGRESGKPVPAAIQLDTGMSRLGLAEPETVAIAAETDWRDGLDLRLVMSHLACADDPDDAMNGTQQQDFDRLRALLGPAAASLANSAGVLLGSDYHYDMVRPGIALYGGNPLIHGTNIFGQVIQIQSKIVQVRQIDSPRTVGYGATHRARGPSRIATVPVGYADGYLRSLGNRGMVSIGGVAVPVVGRVSMDLITVDVTALPEPETRPGIIVDLLGNGIDLDDLAAAAGTIAYELLTRWGPRMKRDYRGIAS